MSYTVLLVEDNPHIMEINHEALMMEDYEVLQAFDGKQCLEQLRNHHVDLVVWENEQIIRALREGGDDYMTKPYDLGVLLAHVEARLRDAGSHSRTVEYEGLRLDTVAMVASYGGDDLLLTKKEFSVLLLLATHGTRPVTKEELCENVWNSPADMCSNALYTTISRMNRKMEAVGVPLIASFSGAEGYILEKI
jgi:DNA-binding response OmpR family regulator